MDAMKILSAGDFHGDRKAAARLAEQAEAENVDLVILCGDLSHADGPVDGIIGPFVAKKKKVLLIPGNHDSFATADFLAELYGVRNIHGYSVQYGDVGIFGCGAATNVGPVSTIPESELYDLLSKGFSRIKDLPKKIMVTHMHPAGGIMEKFSRFVPPSTGVRKAIDSFKPDILLCCHVHEAEGLEEKIGKTLVINVGKQGKILDI